MTALPATPVLALALARVGCTFTQQAAAKPPSGDGPAGNSNKTFAVEDSLPTTVTSPSSGKEILKTETTRATLCRIALEPHGVANDSSKTPVATLSFGWLVFATLDFLDLFLVRLFRVDVQEVSSSIIERNQPGLPLTPAAPGWFTGWFGFPSFCPIGF